MSPNNREKNRKVSVENMESLNDDRRRVADRTQQARFEFEQMQQMQQQYAQAYYAGYHAAGAPRPPYGAAAGGPYGFQLSPRSQKAGMQQQTTGQQQMYNPPWPGAPPSPTPQYPHGYAAPYGQQVSSVLPSPPHPRSPKQHPLLGRAADTKLRLTDSGDSSHDETAALMAPSIGYGSIGLPPTRDRANSQDSRRKETKPKVPKPQHRRALSDIPLKNQHTRRPSDNNIGLPRGHHRRTSSITGSVISTGSQRSVVSDVRQSAFFGGFRRNGAVEWKFPMSYVHLLLTSKEHAGQLRTFTVNPAIYEEYHMDTDNNDDDDELDWDIEEGSRPLPPLHYAMTIEDDAYQRLVDEICSSATMPWGLFFCGHHEDVSHPNIGIAVFFLVLLFGWLIWVAFVLKS